MMEKYRNHILVGIMAFFFFGLSFWCFLKPEEDFSNSERRVLAKKPKLSQETIWNGSFMEKFEEYTADQFPIRDSFRSIKAISVLGLFRNKDNNDIYMSEGYLSKMEYPLQEKMLDYAAGKMEYLYNTYLKEHAGEIYFTIVPDKNYYLAEQNGYLALDYQRLFSYMKEKTEYMKHIDITHLLSLEDYYKTDTHWRQECIVDVADYIGKEMGTELSASYEKQTLDYPFYGVYCGQSALPVEPDTLYYLTNELLEDCKVTSYDTGLPVEKTIYDLEKAYGKDSYDIFLSGADALQVIENPAVKEKKELIVFRDSFGSSLVPLLVEGYSRITVVDIRYINSAMLGHFIDFYGQDVLFLYSTMVLNNSLALK